MLAEVVAWGAMFTHDRSFRPNPSSVEPPLGEHALLLLLLQLLLFVVKTTARGKSSQRVLWLELTMKLERW